jgi:hypothetical protein
MSGRLTGNVCVATGTGRKHGARCRPDVRARGRTAVGCDIAVEPAEETLEAMSATGSQIVLGHGLKSAPRPTETGPARVTPHLDDNSRSQGGN